MGFLRMVARVSLGILKALRLALPKMGVGWMFALLTVNFNQVTIFDLGVTAVLVTSMIGLHYLLSPFQVVFGRIADRHPILGYRRTPYMLLGATITSLVFLLLPSVSVALGNGSTSAIFAGFGLFIIFGIGIAALGDSHHSLIAESVDPRRRGAVIGVAWTLLILSTIISSIVFKVMMPDYTPAAMQQLYNLTPFVVIGLCLLGVVGIERRLKGDALTEAVERSRTVVPGSNPIKAALTVLRENPQARMFFMFVFLSILGIFLQDGILEVFGREVFAMSAGEASQFQVTWGGGVLAGMILMGLLSAVLPIGKKLIASIGSAGTALGLGLLALAAMTERQEMLTPALLVMGASTGLFNVGALSMMMDMTVEGATGLYMGLWGVAQACGNGLANALGGGLRTLLIETTFLESGMGYAAIFGIEAVVMLIGLAVLRSVSIEEFRGINRGDLVRTMEASAAA